MPQPDDTPIALAQSAVHQAQTALLLCLAVGAALFLGQASAGTFGGRAGTAGAGATGTAVPLHAASGPTKPCCQRAWPSRHSASENERNQEAILRLLDEIAGLGQGDLTATATVTEDITGAIADSVNMAVDSLRGLVMTINQSAVQLDGATRQTQALSQHLAKSSSAQARQIASATESIGAMAGSIEEVSGNAERAADVARHSVDIAHKGGEAVRRTIDGMNAIRETIQETSKRIKRLGESSQEIGNIVELINDLAEQTNILALNASIQASMAGEAGRGFAVVADEVQRLAERAANATKQIDALVRTIQADTNGAVVSMERSTTDVVGGAHAGRERRLARWRRSSRCPTRSPAWCTTSPPARAASRPVRAERGAQHAGAARDQLADRRCHQQHLRGHREAGAAVGRAAQVRRRLPVAGCHPEATGSHRTPIAPDPEVGDHRHLPPRVG